MLCSQRSPWPIPENSTVPAGAESIEQSIIKYLDSIEPELISANQDIWTFAELGLEENRSSARLAGPRVPLVKIVASALTLGTGGSGGREGPIAQIGAGFGSFLGRLLRLRPAERRILMAAGMGAGVAAIFRAPLAGALFMSRARRWRRKTDQHWRTTR